MRITVNGVEVPACDVYHVVLEGPGEVGSFVVEVVGNVLVKPNKAANRAALHVDGSKGRLFLGDMPNPICDGLSQMAQASPPAAASDPTNGS